MSDHISGNVIYKFLYSDNKKAPENQVFTCTCKSCSSICTQVNVLCHLINLTCMKMYLP